MRGEKPDSLYGPMIDPLRERFGVTFQLWDTGGGCTALVGEFEGDVAVYITDAPNSFAGRECMITDQPARDRLEAGTIPKLQGDSLFGFAVGVYVHQHQTNVTYGEYPDAGTAILPDLVSDELVAAAERTRDGCAVRGLWRNPTFKEQKP
jgi:hypothetical protein